MAMPMVGRAVAYVCPWGVVLESLHCLMPSGGAPNPLPGLGAPGGGRKTCLVSGAPEGRPRDLSGLVSGAPGLSRGPRRGPELAEGQLGERSELNYFSFYIPLTISENESLLKPTVIFLK